MAADLVVYMWPESEIAQAIVLSLGVLFAVWCLVLARSWVRLALWSKQIGQVRDLHTLRTSTEGEEQRDAAEAAGSQAGLSPRSVSARYKRFNNASQAWELSPRSPVHAHVKALYYAGLEEARLDVAELIAHTSSVALKDYGFLRVVLGAFIVIGLLGTLIGLAESLALLGPALSAGLEGSALTSSLARLLGGLRAAFAPSIVGVALTVVGVLVFSAYVRLPVTAFRSRLEHATLTEWVPALYPTTSQRLTEALERSETQMHRNFEAAERVAEFAGKIEDEITEFGGEVEGTTATLRSLRKAGEETERVSTTLAEATVEFARAAADVTAFQSGVASMMAEAERRAEEFRDEIRETLADMRAGHLVMKKFVNEGLGPTLQGQNKQLADVLGAIQSYREDYMNEHAEAREILQKLLADAQRAYEAIGNSNEELIEHVGNPITTALSEGLTSVHEKVDTGLGSINQTLGRIDTPVQNVATKLEGLLEGFDRRMAQLLLDVQNEFHSRNVNAEENNAALRKLEGRILAVLTSLNEISAAQGETVTDLSTSTAEVRGSVDRLAEAIGRNARTTEALQRAVEGAGAKLRSDRRWYHRVMWWRDGRGG